MESRNMLLRKDKNLFLLAASALCEISLEISHECCLVFAQCVFQGFLTARFALEDGCKFLVPGKSIGHKIN